MTHMSRKIKVDTFDVLTKNTKYYNFSIKKKGFKSHTMNEK